MNWQPESPPTSGNVAELSEWAYRQFLTLSELNLQNYKTLYAAPSKPREGDVVKADGSTWNPGSGAGLYLYLSGSWSKL